MSKPTEKSHELLQKVLLAHSVNYIPLGRLRNEIEQYLEAHREPNETTLMDLHRELIAFGQTKPSLLAWDAFVDDLKRRHPKQVAFLKLDYYRD